MRFDAMTLAQLNDWYERNVGYRPQVDDPTITDDALRALCREVHAEQCKVKEQPAPNC